MDIIHTARRKFHFLSALVCFFASIFSQSFSFADPDDSMIKTVFINGLPNSVVAPGLKKANEEICTDVTELYSKNGQRLAYWTYGEVKDIPKDLYESGKNALNHFQKMITRPAEICGKECGEIYQDMVANAIRDAEKESDPFNKRLTYLSGRSKVCFAVAGKALIQAPIVGLYHATTGLLAVPVKGAWSVFKVTAGATGTVLYNIFKPITTLLRYGQAVTCSGVAAVGVGVANACLPEVPSAPQSANSHLGPQAYEGDMESLIANLPKHPVSTVADIAENEHHHN